MIRLLCLVLAALALVGCREGTSVQDPKELLVSAAASLTDVFGEIEVAFEEENPGVDVILNLGGSSTLREQVLAGAPADVFASASTSIMDEVVLADETAGEPEIFATNELQIAVPAGNPAGVTGLEDFAQPDLLLGICAEGVPCGDLARTSLALAGVEAELDTEEPNVRALLVKIETGELDAGITYTTDVVASGGSVDGLEIPDEWNVRADYPIAVLEGARAKTLAVEYVRFVTSETGRVILQSHGFGLP